VGHGLAHAPERRPGRWFLVVCLLGLVAILYPRLAPFDFAWDGHIPFERVTWHPLTLRDAPLNVLLFVPFGFGLAGLLARRGRQSGAAWRVLLVAALLSAALEAAQLFMPDRVPSVADVAANTLGALLGYGLFRAWMMGFGVALQRYATRRNLLIGLSLYTVGVALLTTYLFRSVHLSNWDTSFPLVVGNEAIGKRQWSGRVETLTLEAGLDSLLFYAPYDLTGDAPFEVSTQHKTAPPLEWREGPATAQNGRVVVVGPGEWLATSEPLVGFSETTSATDDFRIETVVATSDPAQRGPARIVSISADAERRNITIGQEFDALIIRLRTPAAGENGQKPEALVPGVFADQRPRHIDVTYDAPMLRVRVDGEEYALSLAPGAAFFPGFITENRWQISMTSNAHRYDWAYWGIMVGLAVVVFGGLVAARWLTGKIHSYAFPDPRA
jgi:VanZ family protein